MAEPTEEPAGTGETPGEPEVVEEREEPGAPDAEETLAGRTATLERDREAPTERRPPVIEEAPRPDGVPDDAGEGPTGSGAVGRFLRGRAALLARLVREHRAAAAALGLLAVAACVLLALALARAGAVPSAEVVAADARESFSAPGRPTGAFDASGELVTQQVDVRSVSRSQSAPEGTTPPFGASGYATAEVVITYVGQGVRAQRGAQLDYALVNGEWELVGSSEDGLSWQATSGVGQELVLDAAWSLLARADEGTDDNGASLTNIYEESGVTLESEVFDEEGQTDTVVLAFSREGEFLSYSCRLTVTFSFAQASGQWDVSGATVADGARTPDLDSLLGTWEGAFQSQRTDGTRCLAGRSTGLSLNVLGTSVSDSAVMLSGELSGIAHYHAHPSEDREACEGDFAFENVPFLARLSGDRFGSGPLEFVATLPEDVDGQASLTLHFGTADDPSLVEALVETSHSYTETALFIPYERTVTYTDAFTLVHAE